MCIDALKAIEEHIQYLTQKVSDLEEQEQYLTQRVYVLETSDAGASISQENKKREASNDHIYLRMKEFGERLSSIEKSQASIKDAAEDSKVQDATHVLVSRGVRTGEQFEAVLRHNEIS